MSAPISWPTGAWPRWAPEAESFFLLGHAALSLRHRAVGWVATLVMLSAVMAMLVKGGELIWLFDFPET